MAGKSAAGGAAGADAGPVRVGIAGQGRSGWGIHARTIQMLPEQFRVVAVADPIAGRQEEARATLGCRAYADFEPLLADDEVEVLVVSVPNRLHAEYSQRALAAGKHVVCEKPFALTAADADATIAAAQRAGRLVVPFQNRRYEPHFRKVREVVDSGVLGDLLHVRIASHSFGRRWDWQTLLDYGGGQAANNGPHALDHAMHFLGDGEVRLFADLRNGLSSGDAEDHFTVCMKAETGPRVDVEVSTCVAYPQDRWFVAGTRGGLRGTTSELHWRCVDWETLPPRPVDERPTPDRSYNREKLEWREESWTDLKTAVPDNRAFYEDLYRTLRLGAPPAIRPESARRYVAVLEQCRAQYRPERAQAAAGSGA
jgi:scyllo-inositol 2-dehydrogenase (NADP+)